MCIPAMELAGAEARYDQIHEERPYHDGSFENWAKERSDEFPYYYRDGVKLWVAKEDVNPDDDFLTKPGPTKPAIDPLGG